MSLLNRLAKVIGLSEAQDSAGIPTPVGFDIGNAILMEDVPAEAFYPPQDPGLPVVAPMALVVANTHLIQRLKELTVSDRDNFEFAYLSPIQKLAELVQLLPASSHEHYSAPAGLFKMCLDLAFFSLQSADGKIFTPNETIEMRHRNEPRWRYATFMAAMTSQIYRSLTLMTVANERGEEWPRFSKSMTEWLQSTNTKRYFIKWHSASNVTGAEGASVLAKIIPTERYDWLAQGDVQIVRDMNQVAMGASHQSDSIMASVIGAIHRRVMDVDEAVRRDRYGALTIGMHLEPYILDAMRYQIENGVWKVNQVGSPVWYGSDGLFIEWPKAHEDIQKVFRKMALTGVPASSITVAEVLGKGGVVIQNENGLWVRDMLVPEEKSGPRIRKTTGLRFVDAMTIFGFLEVKNEPWPFGAELVHAEELAGANLITGTQRKPTTVEPERGQKDEEYVYVEPSAQVEKSTKKPEPKDTHAMPAPELPLPLNPATDQETGEVSYANLIKAESKRWIKSADIAETLGHLIHLHSLHRGEAVKQFNYGVALSVDWIVNATPTEITQFIKIFETNRWLGKPSGVKNDALKLHEVQFDDGVKSAIVLSVQGAKAIGFNVGVRN